MPKPILYKYRSLENWKFIVDIVVNSRLHAAPFGMLNDPMEGRYYFFGDEVSRGFTRAIFDSKQQHNICSLSQEKASTLLWSYYAGGHTGVAFGVQVLDKRSNRHIEIRSVTYDNGVYIGRAAARRSPEAVALDILTQKQLPWQHEKEVRVFSKSSFVRVKLKTVVLGCNITSIDQELLTALVRRWHPGIKVEKLNRGRLDHPEATVFGRPPGASHGAS